MKCPNCKADISEDSHFCSKCGASLKPSKGVSVTKTLQKPAKGFQKDSVIAKKYRIIDKIGEGGMGVVYRAKDTRLKRSVALKFLPPELTQNKEAKKRFLQEAQAAAALEHPNICTVYEVDEAVGQTFIAMSYIEGQSLKDKLKDGPLDIDEAKDIALQVAEGLKEAHEKGIVHRDIKPANIMLTKKGQAKITDFGLAKLSWGADLTKPSIIMGTVAYMSPEQARGEEVDHRTDIWSLGALLYEMLSGVRPFQKAQEQALIYAILNDKPTPLSLLRPDIPDHLEHMIEKALAKKAADRYQNVDGLIKDLKEAPSTTVSQAKKSIAVLPFTNMSADPEQEYFCDGISEEIINALTQIQDLRVVARTSAFAFKGRDVDIREIGKKLNVDKILEGSVRKAGNRLRITAQLINVSDGYHLWSERFDRKMADIFDIQDEISLAIVNNLKIRLLSKEKATILKQPTKNLDAYNLYLKGRYSMNLYTDHGLNEAIDCFEEAIKNDPSFAHAYAEMALSYVLLGVNFGIVHSPDAYDKAREAAKKSVELDPYLAEAHTSHAAVATFYEWDRNVAADCFRRAIELNPNNSYTRQWYAYYLFILEHKHVEAIEEFNRAIELNPLDLGAFGFISIVYSLGCRDFDQGVEVAEKIVAMAPNLAVSHHFLADALEKKGLYKESIAEMEEANRLGGRSRGNLACLGYTYAKAGQPDKAYEIIEELKERHQHSLGISAHLAWIYCGMGQEDEMFECLDRAYEERNPWLTWFTTIREWDDLCKAPRFITLIEKMGLSHLLPKEE